MNIAAGLKGKVSLLQSSLAKNWKHILIYLCSFGRNLNFVQFAVFNMYLIELCGNYAAVLITFLRHSATCSTLKSHRLHTSFIPLSSLFQLVNSFHCSGANSALIKGEKKPQSQERRDLRLKLFSSAYPCLRVLFSHSHILPYLLSAIHQRE